MHKNATPLKVWIGVMSIFFIVQTYLYISNDKGDSRLDITFDTLYKEIEDSFNSADSSAIKVVVIGTSLTGFGVSCSDDIRDYAKTEYGLNVELRKVFFNSDNFRYFVEKQELLKKLIRLETDIIIIQTEALAVRLKLNIEKSQHLLKFIEELSIQNRELIKKTANVQYKKKGKKKFLQGCYPRNAFKLPPTIDTLFDLKPSLRIIKPQEERAFAFDDLKACKEKGIQVIMLDFPRPYKVEEMVTTPSFNISLEKLAKEYQEEFGIEHWTYDETMYFSQFRDYGHLNASGREIFTTWLVDEIVKKKSE